MCMDENAEAFINYIKKLKLWTDLKTSIKSGDRKCFSEEEFNSCLDMICKGEETLEKGKSFYRARLLSSENYDHMKLSDVNEGLNDSGIHGLSKEEMGAPPPEKTVAGRANPKGVSYLYLATNPEIACAEIQPTLFDLISVAKFKLTQNIKVVNLKHRSVKKISIQQKKVYRDLIKEVMEAFSMPYRSTDIKKYLISQAVTEKIKEKDFDGIMYGSMNAMSNPGEISYNLVLFDKEKASCISDYGMVYRLAQRSMVFQNISVLGQKTCKADSKPNLFNKIAIEKMRQDLLFEKKEKRTNSLKNLFSSQNT